MLPEKEYLIPCGTINYYGDICAVFAINAESGVDTEQLEDFGDLIFETPDEGLVRYITGIVVENPLPLTNLEDAERLISNGTFGDAMGFVCTQDGKVYVLINDEKAEVRDMATPAQKSNTVLEINLDEVYSE